MPSQIFHKHRVRRILIVDLFRKHPAKLDIGFFTTERQQAADERLALLPRQVCRLGHDLIETHGAKVAQHGITDKRLALMASRHARARLLSTAGR